MRRRKRTFALCLAAILIFGMVTPAMPVMEVNAKSSLEKKVEKIVKKQTKPSASVQKNLKALFQYVEKNYNYKHVIGFNATKGWEKKYAQEMLASEHGSCYHFAALYAFLAKKASGYQVRVCIGKTNGFEAARWQFHGWCEVKVKGTWYVCDPNLDKYGADSKCKYFMKKFSKVKKNYKRSKSIKIKF